MTKLKKQTNPTASTTLRKAERERLIKLGLLHESLQREEIENENDPERIRQEEMALLNKMVPRADQIWADARDSVQEHKDAQSLAMREFNAKRKRDAAKLSEKIYEDYKRLRDSGLDKRTAYENLRTHYEMKQDAIRKHIMKALKLRSGKQENSTEMF